MKNARSKVISTALAGTILATAGITAIPEDKYYKDVSIPVEHQEQLGRRGHGLIERAERGDLIRRESWLLPDKLVDVIPKVYTTVLSTGVNNYLDDGVWKDIDTNFSNTTGGFEVTKAPNKFFAPEFSDGFASYIKDSEWDYLRSTTTEEDPLILSIDWVGVNRVRGSLATGTLVVTSGVQSEVQYTIYQNAYQDADLIYYLNEGDAVSLNKILCFNKKPTTFTYSYDITFNRDIAFSREVSGKMTTWREISTMGVPKGSILQADAKDGARQVVFRPFSIWDSDTDFYTTGGYIERNTEYIQIDVEPLGNNSYRFTKILPESFFDNAVYPVCTDATETEFSTTGDGKIDADETAWADTHDAASGNSAGTGGNTLRPATNSAAQYRIDRIWLYFPDPEVPAGNTVSNIDFDLYGTGSNGNADSTDIMLELGAQSTPLVAGDYSSVTEHSPTHITNDVNIADANTSGYETFTATQSYIDNDFNKNSTNLVAVRVGTDADEDTSHGNAPTGLSDWIFSSADHTGTSQDPKMTITHAVPAGEQVIIFHYSLKDLILRTAFAEESNVKVVGKRWDLLFNW